ncbi:hypothetical protein EG344_00740 [Chryseobacterium sp. G0162]|uniref:hypothetical protein n=1 Tax=Chryseobacterium sp. G0162 TaxID=2487063 RepID=UPI000F4D410F|nr:hypothetical protein [Chryseobacterium sp. G0162]AZB07469.1 hypothetical protein EG344_00740 [Chryseobacterium sp. G0162]
MKNQKILRKLEDLSLFRKVTIHIGGNVEATLRDRNINDTDFRHLLSEFNPKKFNINLTTVDGELVVKIEKLPSLSHYRTHPVFVPGHFPDMPLIRPFHRRF